MDFYHVLEMIGEGSFGRVYKGRKKFSGQVVALKFIPKVGRSEKELRNLKREIDIMRGLQHPNIVLLLDSFETEREVVVVTEYAEGELFQILEDDGNLPESQVCDIACQLVSALYYLHSHRILHRDMKPQNILLGKGGVVKLCDFGFARAMSVSTLVLTSIKGTPLYMSPELVEEKPYDHTADLWSLGCILYELHTGAPPFYTNSIFQLVQLIVRDPVKWPDTMSQTCMTFLKGLLTKDPQKRLSWPHLLKHPFVADGVLVLSDPVVSSPLTVAPSPDLQVLKLQQAVQKAAPHGGEGRLLRKAREQRDKRNRQVGNGKTESSSRAPSRTAPAVKPLSKDSLVAPSDGLDQDLSQLTANLSLTPKQSAIEISTNSRGQISRDYEQEFPSVEVGPRQALRRPETQERGQARTSLSAVRLHSQDVDSDEEWERLIQQTSVSSGQTIQIIPRLKEKLLTSKTLLLDGILEGACQIRQPLKVLSNLILTSDSEDSHRLRQEVGLPHFLFNLVQDIVENPVVVKQPWSVTVLGEVIVLLLNYWEKHRDWQQADNKLEDYAMPFFKILLRPDPNPLAPLAAAILAIFSQCGVSVVVSMDRITAQLNKLLSDSDEQESPPHSASLDPSILRLLWVKVGTSLEKTSARTKFCSSNGLYVFLSLALFVLTRDPYCCVPLFSDSDTNCLLTLGHLLTTDCVSRLSDETHGQLWGGDSSVNSLSVLSCHLLCFPFALDLSSETMDRLLQLYHSAGIVSGLLQVIQSVPPSLLELPLSLLCRLLLCDPGRSVPCFTAAARAQGFFSPPSSDPKDDRRDQAPASSVGDQAGHPVSVSRTASSLLSDLLKPDSEALWGSAVELFTLLSQAARCSPRSRPSTPHLHLEPTPLHQALAHPDDRVRAAACSLLGNLDPFTPHTPPSTSDPQRTRLQPAILRDIIGCLHDPSASVRRMACKAVGNWLGLIGKAEFRTRRANGRENSSASIAARDMKKGKPDKTVSSQSLVGDGGDSSTTLKQQVADQEDGSGWVEEANWATTELLSLIADPDALTRRHCCAALGNMAAVEGGVASLLEGDVPLLLLQAACTDSQHAVQRAAVATLSLYSQQDALRQALLSLDAREKLRQASQHVAPPQCDYCQIIKLL
ncbi:serine/threonine-protein kinase 36 isoform X4 [Salmo salar]|uniref:non-specific serine/threonine protein kinase n=1 Tax=Salmo salar TaxID=8030 RepID=A0A1S3RGE0_SALSA|nr:serine/threonine-protein kinase 36 isoform X4 [Salmo salar]|eukprot:XP_014051286.1 PREDICTED: serine/threonine-protein kinase 36 isoform X4 [Salmo salar]